MYAWTEFDEQDSIWTNHLEVKNVSFYNFLYTFSTPLFFLIEFFSLL